MKVVRQVGLGRVVRFVWTSLLLSLFRVAFLPPVRTLLLRAFGASVGADTVIQRCTFINADRGGFGGLRIGASCFIGDEVLIDLAAAVTLEDQVTLAARSMLFTHLNVGYLDHPLHARFPSQTTPVVVRRGSFIGAGAIVLAGCEVGPEAFVGAASLVNRRVSAGETVGGVPIRPIAAGRAAPTPSGRV